MKTRSLLIPIIFLAILFSSRVMATRCNAQSEDGNFCEIDCKNSEISICRGNFGEEGVKCECMPNNRKKKDEDKDHPEDDREQSEKNY